MASDVVDALMSDLAACVVYENSRDVSGKSVTLVV